MRGIFPNRYENHLYYRTIINGVETPVYLRRATDEEIEEAFNNFCGILNDYVVFVDIDGVKTKCYIEGPYESRWHTDRNVTDNIEVNDGVCRYYSTQLFDPSYVPEDFENGYDHGGYDGPVTATMTDLCSGETYTWKFYPTSDED